MLRGAGQLLLGGVPFAERHGDELADDALSDAVPIQPRLVGDHQVVLRIGVEVVVPGLATDRTHLPGGHLHRAGI